MCAGDGEPKVAFTTKAEAFTYVEEVNSTCLDRLEVVDIRLKDESDT